jgi:hypothetical protein
MDTNKRYISLVWVFLFPLYLFGQDIFRVNLYPVKSSAELNYAVPDQGVCHAGY